MKMNDTTINTRISVNWDDVARILLKENFLLSALELHTELIESGNELPRLREYFSNPAHFDIYHSSKNSDINSTPTGLLRTSSQTTLDSFDWARYSEDGERVVDERVAVLEFELRKAKETIQGLRKNLTQLTEPCKSTNDSLSGKEDGSIKVESASIKHHERLTLNFLINEYLVYGEYKLTAITFSEENDNKDFDHWDDVGLDIPRPPSLVHLLRGEQVNTPESKPDQPNLDCLVNESEEHLNNLNLTIKSLQDQLAIKEEELLSLRQLTSTPACTPQKSTPSKKISTINDNENISEYNNNNMAADLFLEDYIEDLDCPQSIEDLVENYDSCDNELSDCKNINILSGNKEFNTSTKESTIIETTPSSHLNLLEGSRITLDDFQQEVFMKTEENDARSTTTSCEDLPTEHNLNNENIEVENFTELSKEHFKYMKEQMRSSTTKMLNSMIEAQVLDCSLLQRITVDSRLQSEISQLNNLSVDILFLITNSLYKIAPNIILSKREELLPLLVYTISKHKNSSDREKLLHLLFNLIKRPDSQQRNAILMSLSCLAKVIDPMVLESELLPQCWGQLNHKYFERRLLVAESVAVLSPYTTPELRNSLLLSMLLQLLGPDGEKDMLVRDASMISLSLIVIYLDDCSKVVPLISVLIHCLETYGLEHNLSSTCLSSVSHNDPLNLLLNSLTYWCLQTNNLQTYLQHILDKLDKLFDNSNAEIDTNEPKLNSDKIKTEKVLLLFYHALQSALPCILALLIQSFPEIDMPDITPNILLSSPEISNIIDEIGFILDSKDKAREGIYNLRQYMSKEWFKSWDQLDYFTKHFLPNIVQLLKKVDISSDELIRANIHFFTSIHHIFGQQVSLNHFVPLFLKELTCEEHDIESVRNGTSGLTSAVLVIYTVAFLGSGCDSNNSDVHLQEFLSRQLSILSLCGASLKSIECCIINLLAVPNSIEHVLGSLWSGVVHKNATVRSSCASLWGLLVGHLKEQVLSSSVVPALVTLATDSDVKVRASSISPLCKIIISPFNKETCDKAMLQLESVCEESQVLEYFPLQMALVKTARHISHTNCDNLLHHLILPRLCKACLEGKETTQEKHTFESALLDTFGVLTTCSLPDHVVAHFILPPLNILQKSLGSASYEYMETITMLTHEYTMRVQASAKPIESRMKHSSSLSSGISSSLNITSMSSGLATAAGVEDVKNSLSKMFSAKSPSNLQTKAPSLNFPSIFKKK